MTEPSSSAAPKSICRISRLIFRAVELRAGMFGIERKACDRQSAAALLRLVDGAGKVALEGFPGEQAGSRIDQAIGVDRLQGAAQMRFEGMLADQRQHRGYRLGGVVGDDFEICKIRSEVPDRLPSGRREGCGSARPPSAP